MCRLLRHEEMLYIERPDCTGNDVCRMLLLQALLKDIMAMTRAGSGSASSSSSQTHQDTADTLKAGDVRSRLRAAPNSAALSRQQGDSHEEQCKEGQSNNLQEASGTSAVSKFVLKQCDINAHLHSCPFYPCACNGSADAYVRLSVCQFVQMLMSLATCLSVR